MSDSPPPHASMLENPLFPPRPTDLAHTILREAIRPGDTVIDATAGNGHDTVFLAEIVGSNGRVLAFDIQASAIEAARTRVAQARFADRVEFHASSHARMAEFAAPDSITAVMFNLGYLPGHDHALTTLADETLTAIDAAAIVLKPGGVLSVVCYPGHPAGATEAAAVEKHITYLTSIGWHAAIYAQLNTRKPPPFLLLARKP